MAPSAKQAAALRELVDALELGEATLIKKSLKTVGRFYAGVNLEQALALYALAAESANPKGRLAQLPLLMGEVDRSASALSAALSELTPLTGQAVELGVRNTAEACRVLAPGTSWSIPAERELLYAADVQARYADHWAKEAPRFRWEVQKVLEQGLERGVNPRQLGRQLEERLRVSRSRADLIAANEISNARAYAMQQTQFELGITRYQWSATGGKRGDGRTREEHRRLHGGVFPWNEPGPAENGAHPGQAIRCRCVALPFVDDLLE